MLVEAAKGLPLPIFSPHLTTKPPQRSWPWPWRSKAACFSSFSSCSPSRSVPPSTLPPASSRSVRCSIIAFGGGHETIAFFFVGLLYDLDVAFGSIMFFCLWVVLQCLLGSWLVYRLCAFRCLMCFFVVVVVVALLSWVVLLFMRNEWIC